MASSLPSLSRFGISSKNCTRFAPTQKKFRVWVTSLAELVCFEFQNYAVSNTGAKEKREDYTKQQQNEVESLENYYRDQFNLLAETIAKERHELNVSDRAQANAMQRIKSDMRRKMEKEIREYQDQLYRDEDAEYFRQLEADRMKHELQMAKYKAQL